MTETSVEMRIISAVSNVLDNSPLEQTLHRIMQELGPPPVHDPAPGPDDLAATADLAGRARRAMAKLSNEQRSALELAYFGGRTTAEVAALEGIPQGTAKTRIHAALLKLRAEMAKEADDDV